MTSDRGPGHVVVDGSNLATEGRSLPSLAQLSEAVMSFMEEHPDTTITVVVDATFGHRIDKKEVKEFEEGISNNELVAPPAGAIGRGDAFVLSIAQKANASILSNDSFQEFHADYEWLFDEGRLIGGKPVPHVGWVFVNRSPVRGPVSRKATQGTMSKKPARRGTKQSSTTSKRRLPTASRSANEPMPVPTSPPPGPAPETGTPAKKSPSAAPRTPREKSPAAAPRGGDPVNEPLPFLEFVEHHPVGTSINGTVESYSSHGAYVTIGDDGVRAYVPLRLMADPAPTSARKVMRLGESVTLVVVSFAAARRSIDCAVPDLAQAAIADAQSATEDDDDADEAPETRKRSKKTAATKTPAKKAPAKKTAAKKTAAKKTAAKKTAAKKTAAKKAPAKKTAVNKTSPKKSPAKKASPKKASPKKSPAKKASPKKSPTNKTSSKKSPAKESTAKESSAKESAAKKSAARKSSAKKTPTKKSARSIPAKNTAVGSGSS